jgi:DNA-binding beta-propeller fold protein YncE
MRTARWATLCSMLLGLSAFNSPTEAQEVKHLVYAAVPGIGNDAQFGGIGILVFDRDQGHKFVRRITTWPTYTREAPEPIKGIAASVESGLLYVSTTRRLAAFDLKTDKLVWQKGYDADCCDRMAVSPDGKVLYVPSFGFPKWYVVDAHTGDVITTVTKDGEAHNTIYSPSGERVYLAALRSPTMVVLDPHSNKVIREVGPFSNQIRPFTINGKETIAYVSVNDLLGVGVGDLKTGKVLAEVSVPGYPKGKPRGHGTISHGVALTHDETEVWVADGPNKAAHIFDATVMPPKYKQTLTLRDEVTWFTCSIDGTLIYPASGEVVDVKSKKILGALTDEQGRAVETEKLLEVDFAGDRPVKAGDQFCFGEKR